MGDVVDTGKFAGGPLPEKHGVVPLPCVTNMAIPPSRVLQAALDSEDPLDGVVVMGFTKSGDTYFASSYADGGTVLWLWELLKARLLPSRGR